MFVKLLLISAVFLVLAFTLLGIRMLLKPGSRFPETHVGHNKEMRKRGIKCAQSTDIGCNPGNRIQGCESCDVKL